MNWENIDHSAEEVHCIDRLDPKLIESSIHEQNERKRVTQLGKLLNHKNYEQRNTCIEIMTRFGELLVKNEREEIANTLLTENCETFIINFADIFSVEQTFSHQEFIGLLKGYQTIQREVKETFVDTDKGTGFQICYCTILNEKEALTASQFSFEVFSFKGDKVCKYRASFGSMPAANEPQKLFIPSTKEKMLAKVKELNYAWADQPNFEKIASLLHESSEYKIWRWKDEKLFTFDKHNLASDFRKNLEEDFVIKSIVPFDPKCEAQYVVGSYVYYLEGKRELSSKKYQWMSNCLFAFDRDLNITKISQQGELHLEDDVPIPFEVYPQEKIIEKIHGAYETGPNNRLSLFNNNGLNFSFDLCLFGPSNAPFPGVIKGFNEYNKLLQIAKRRPEEFKLAKPIDIYLDLDGPCYETAVTIDCTKTVLTGDDPLPSRQHRTMYCMRKFSFENESIAKLILFLFVFPGDMPSLYDINSPNSNISKK